MTSLHLAVLAPFLFALIVPAAHKLTRRFHTGWLVLILPFTLLIYFITNYPLDPDMLPVIHTVPWIPSLNIHFTVYLDSLALLFSLLITGIGTLVVLYSIFYMSREREKLHHFYVYLLLFMGAMLGSVLSDNLLTLYAFWELTSISSFLLIAFWYQRKRSRYGAQKSLLITVTGGFVMLLGFLMLSSASGTLSIRELISMSDQIAAHPLFIPAMLCILLGAFTKSAQFPFHIWLPDAMEAPTPVSAYLHSATMVKAGIYLVARLTPIFGGSSTWFWVIMLFGIITLFWGSFTAIRQNDLKALLAYSTISQLGMMMCLLGIGSLAQHAGYSEHALLFTNAILAAVFHLINHSIFKGCLFMVIGILDHEAGTRDIRRLGGLIHIMPISFTLTVIGAFSMAGLPPFGGFLSKEMFFTGVLSVPNSVDSWLVLLPIVAWIASIFTFVYSMILVFKAFTGPYKPEMLDRTPHEAPLGMLIAPTILAAFVIALFFYPNVLSDHLLEPVVKAIVPFAPGIDYAWQVNIQPWHGWKNLELYMTIGVIALGTLLFRRLRGWLDLYTRFPWKFTLNQAYDRGLTGLEKWSAVITDTYMTGSIRHYLIFIFMTMVGLISGSLLLFGAVNIDLSANAPMELYEIALGLAVVAAASHMLFSKSRLISIMTLSVVGYIVSLYFVIFRAPDLALTQLVVETISTALFLLCFYFLPKVSKQIQRVRFRAVNLLISLGVGITLTLVGLAAQGHRLFEPISEYFQGSYELAGARNMVNAILVDFRAFDTMLEIVVLFTAGVGVYTLIHLRRDRREER